MVLGNNTFFALNDWSDNEDKFWGIAVPRIHQWFRVAACEQAAKFSMEANPRRLYRLTKNQLPFGCHAWWRYDYDFWEPHVRKFGFEPHDPRRVDMRLSYST